MHTKVAVGRLDEPLKFANCSVDDEGVGSEGMLVWLDGIWVVDRYSCCSCCDVWSNLIMCRVSVT